MQATQAVIFDLDGCLVDSEIHSLRSLAAEMRAAGVHDVTTEELGRRFLGVSLSMVCEDVAERTGHPCPDGFAERFEARLIDTYRQQPLRPYDAVPGMLDMLQERGIAMAIATGGSLRRMHATLEISGLDRWFRGRAFSADQVEHGKPAPDLFLFAAARLGVDPARCVVMEDSPHGVKGAVAAGMRAVGFTGGAHLQGKRREHGDKLTGAGAALVKQSLEGMAEALLIRQHTRKEAELP